jgi:hypothetical protein
MHMYASNNLENVLDKGRQYFGKFMKQMVGADYDGDAAKYHMHKMWAIVPAAAIGLKILGVDLPNPGEIVAAGMVVYNGTRAIKDKQK